MLQPVDIGDLSLDIYEQFLPEEVARLRELAAEFKGARILHINATPYGGGVSELLRSLVPLECALGMDSHWRVISGDEPFFRVTKAFHNALQGGVYHLTKADEETYLTYNTRNAQSLELEYDFIIVHDPQPAAMRHLHPGYKGKWIWRCHIDTSNCNQEIWEFFDPLINLYDMVIFTLPDFIPQGFNGRVETILPAIDPLSPKNMELPGGLGKHLLNWIGMPKDGPIICQVSRFDPWKDPLGVIEAYRLVKEEHPGVRLALIGSMALDDPQGWDMYNEIAAAAQDDRHFHVFTNLVGVGDLQVNAFQRMSDVVIQKSIREGFGLVVSETLWKETPVVAGNAGGIPSQMAGGGGFLVSSVEETATRVLEFLKKPELAAEEGRKGKAYVREHFLITRLIEDHLKIMKMLST